MLTVVYRAAGVLLLALTYFAAAAADMAAVTVAVAVLVGVAASALQLIIDSAPGPIWPRIVLATAAAAIGAVLVPLVQEGPLVWPWMGVLVASSSAWIMAVVLARRHMIRCALCKRPLHRDDAGLRCPRCERTVCARSTCWLGRYARCASCHERGVVLFPSEPSWWDIRFGPRVKEGQCSVCLKTADLADLRACGQCRFPICQRCWDHHNGRCERCGWVVPQLPPVLRPWIGQSRRRPAEGASPSRRG